MEDVRIKMSSKIFMTTTLEDMKGGESNCCGALMYEDLEICSDCGKPCENTEELEDLAELQKDNELDR